MTESLALAVAAGMAATVNPCGFALLPAYLAAFVGLDGSGGGVPRAIGRALAVSAVLTAGFVAVFGAFGAVVTPFALRIEQHLPWVTIVIGVGLVGLGVVLLSGREISLRIPRLSRGGRDGTLPSMFLFGVSFAVASLSCTIGPFLAVTTATFRAESWLSGMTVFVAYGLGMGVVITILTVSVALAREGAVRRVRSLIPRVNRIAGGLLVVAGVYVAYFGWYEIRVLGGATGDPIVDRASAVQSWLQRTIVPADPTSFLVTALVIIAAVGAAAAIASRRRSARNGTTEPGSGENPLEQRSLPQHRWSPSGSPVVADEIVVYWRPGCLSCAALLRQLDKRGVAHRRVNIWDDPSGAEVVRAAANGNETVPTVAVGPVTVVNPDVHAVLSLAADHVSEAVPADYEPPQPGRFGRWVLERLGDTSGLR